MKNFRFNYMTLLLAGFVLLSSCGKQLYSYREKIKVDKPDVIVKKETKQDILMAKKLEVVSNKPTIVLQAPQQNQVKLAKETAGIETALRKQLPASGSKAAFQAATHPTKNLKKQFKSLHKELKKLDAKESQSLVSNPIKWMIIGLILIVAGAIIGFAVSSAGGFIAGIGSLIFLIGLLFWLLGFI